MSENDFHAHLEVCQQCRKQIFNLCPVGMKLLEATAKTATDSMFKGLARWNRVLSNK